MEGVSRKVKVSVEQVQRSVNDDLIDVLGRIRFFFNLSLVNRYIGKNLTLL